MELHLLAHFSEIPGWIIWMMLALGRPSISSLKNIKLGLGR